MSFYGYKIGTIAVTNGSAAAVGTSTFWSASVTDGDQCWILGAGADWHPYEVQVNSDTSITFDRPYLGSTGSALAYVIFPSSAKRDSGAFVSKQLADLISRYGSLISVTGNDRVFSLDKAGSSDNAGIWLKQNGTSFARFGLFGDNNLAFQYLVSSTWTTAFGLNTSTGALTFAGSLDATSPTAAGLIAPGGVGIAKKLFTGDTTDASAIGTASVVMLGGLGVAKKIFAGGALNVTDATAASSVSTGSGIFAGGLGVAGKGYFGGALNVTDTTAASSVSTGSGIFAGGLGVAGKGFFGGALKVTDTTAASSVSTGSGIFAGGLGVAGKSYFGDVLNVTNASAASSTTTGCAIFSGGIGVAGNIYSTYLNATANDSSVKLYLSATNNHIRVNYYGGTADFLLYMPSDGHMNWYLYGTGDIFTVASTGMTVTAGMAIGGPSGGILGSGKLNVATGVYVNNGSALTCFGIEYLIDGEISLKKWDDYAHGGHNALAHFYADMIKTFDPRDHKQYIARLKKDRALPGMWLESEYTVNEMELNALTHRLWLSQEILATAFVGHVDDTESHFETLDQQIKRLTEENVALRDDVSRLQAAH